MGITNIGLYIACPIPSSVSLTNLEKGNPGIGGTEYLVLMLATHFSSCETNTVTLYLQKKVAGLSASVRQIEVPSFTEAINYHKALPNSLMICGPHEAIGHPVLHTAAMSSGIRFVLWAHVEFHYLPEVVAFANCDAVKAVVFLTAHSYAHYDKRIRKKSVIIGHPSMFLDVAKREAFSNEIVFLGALVPLRRCENLLQVLPDIISRYPECHLTVFGGGNLYDRSLPLGPMGVANPEYEAKLSLIIDENNLHDRVSFKGNVALSECITLLNHAAVGVANPRYQGYETFCLSAVEMGSFGLPVIAGDIDGLKDTLPRGCGYRVKSNNKLKKRLIQLLGNQRKNMAMGEKYRAYIAEKYAPTRFFGAWDDLANLVSINGRTLEKTPTLRLALLVFENRLHRLVLKTFSRLRRVFAKR